MKIYEDFFHRYALSERNPQAVSCYGLPLENSTCWMRNKPPRKTSFSSVADPAWALTQIHDQQFGFRQFLDGVT